MMEKSGIINNARGFGADEEPPPDPNQPLQDQFGEDSEATPEEQADYDMVVARAIKFMHGQGRDQVLQMLSAGNRPAESIGAAAATIVRSIQQSAKEAGKELDDGVLFHAGVEIVEELADYGEQAGVFKFASEDEAQKETEEGLGYALKNYGEMALADGTIDDERVQGARELMQQGLQREQQYGHPDVVNGVRGAIVNQMGTPPPGGGQGPGIIGMARNGSQ